MPYVYTITGYTGVKSGDIDKISSTDDDVSILEAYFEEGASFMQDIFMRYGELEYTGTVAIFNLTMPSNWKVINLTAIQYATRQWLINYICMQWFNLSKKDDVASYREACDRFAESIRKYLFERVKPTRV